MDNKKFEKLNIPSHIAFIMDGNRRWAKKRGLYKLLGHKRGAKALKDIVKVLLDLKQIKYASFFGFSTENWNREKKEVDYLFDIAYNMLVENEAELIKDNIKFSVMGDVSPLPENLRNIILKVQDETKDNSALCLYIGINYGGRDDIVQAVKKLDHDQISVENIKKNLYCPYDIDLLIRTSGEQRVSNFMLYQMAYSEFYFAKCDWPDFDKKQLYKAIKSFSKRHRRFGGR